MWITKRILQFIKSFITIENMAWPSLWCQRSKSLMVDEATIIDWLGILDVLLALVERKENILDDGDGTCLSRRSKA